MGSSRSPVCCRSPSSTYHDHEAKRRDPSRLYARAKRDAALKVEVRRVFEETFRVYGVRKVWRQLSARARFRPLHGARLMRQMGLGGDPRQAGGRRPRATRRFLAHSTRSTANSRVCAEQAVGERLCLRGHLGRLRLRRLRHRYLCKKDRWLAGEPDGACRLCARRTGTGPP